MKISALFAAILAAAAFFSGCAPAPEAPDESDWYADMFGRELSAEQAAADADFGKYILNRPGGLDFEGARRIKKEGQDELSVRFFSEGNFVNLRIAKMHPEHSYRVADTANPESYDLSLYDDPFGPYTPGEYLMTLENPIFEASQITPEIIAARGGKEDKLQLKFGLLFDEVLVDISSGGVEPEALHESITAIAQ